MVLVFSILDIYLLSSIIQESCFIYLLNILFYFVCVPECMYSSHTCRGLQRSEEVSSPLELELQICVSCLKSRSTGGAANVFYC